tara:strand:- start:2831 stop:3568 length:738 start_codon:yes stop_codon:yes gene_type:complete
MAYNFLGLVNDINRRLNEVELTSANFATAVGFYGQAKDAITASIRYVNQSQYEWPFNHVEQEDTLSVGVSRYPFPTDCKVIDFDTFRIKENTALGNSTSKLPIIVYEEYLDKYVDQEYNSTSTSLGQGVPQRVAHAPSLEYIVTPVPNAAYSIVYEYYRIPVDMILYNDVPSVPERFRHVLVDGAMHYAYLFRGNTQDALVAKENFEDGIKNMRSMLINRYSYLRSYLIPQNTGGGNRGSTRFPR